MDFGHLPHPGLLESGVVNKNGSTVPKNLNQRFGEFSPGVIGCSSQEVLVLYFCSWSGLNVTGPLKGHLRLRSSPRPYGQGWIDRLKIDETVWVRTIIQNSFKLGGDKRPAGIDRIKHALVRGP